MNEFIKYRIILCFAFLAAGIVISENTADAAGDKVFLLLAVLFSLLTLYRKQLFFSLFLPLGILITPAYEPSAVLNEFETKRITVEGILTANPENRTSSTRLFIRADRLIHAGRVTDLNDNIVIYSASPVTGISTGHRVMIRNIRLSRIEGFSNPGNFDIASFFARKNIFYSGFADGNRDIYPLGEDPDAKGLLYLADSFRSEYADFVRRYAAYPQNEIINALTVGKRESMPPSLRERFSALGIAHVFAISGLHIGIIAFLFYRILKWSLKRSRYLMLRSRIPCFAAALTILPVFLYTAIAGFPTSAVRAMIMINVYLVSLILGKNELKLNSLAAAGIIILLLNPYSLYDLSFMLSFLAVSGILLCHIFYPFSANGHGDKIRSGIKATVSATVATLPLTVNTFGYMPVSTIPANLIIVPIIELVILPLGLISLLIYPLSPLASSYVLRINSLFTELIIDLTGVFDTLKITYFTFPVLNTDTVILIFASGICLLLIGRNRLFLYMLPFVLVLTFASFVNTYSKKPPTDLVIRYFDSGYKNIFLIEIPGGKTILIKGGYSRSSASDFIERAVIVPFLLSEKITKIDFLLLTSLDRSHIKGTKTLLNKIKVENLWTNGAKLDGKLWEIINTENIRWNDISSGIGEFSIADVEFRFIKPRGHGMIWDSRRPLPLIIKLTHGHKSLILGESIENRYVQKELTDIYSSAIESDVIFIPRMYDDAELNEFIVTVNPEYVICKKCNHSSVNSAGSGKNEIRFYESDISGMIKTVSDGKDISISGYLE